MRDDQLSNFFLYGEAPKSADSDFVHFESLSIRSKPSDWIIDPHKHADLHHIIAISEGSGQIRFESAICQFEGAQVIIVPAGCVHGFEWQPHIQGMIMTISEVHLRHLASRHRDVSSLFDEPLNLAASQENVDEMLSLMNKAERELGWDGFAQSAAIEGCVLSLLASGSRLRSLAQKQSHIPTGRDLDLIARLRGLVEQRFRRREPIASYAKELGVSLTTLRDACARHGQSPTQMRDQRAIVEAQRLLSYSANPIAVIGAKIGFEDPAYFSRFFTRHCGQSPARWRQSARKKGAQRRSAQPG